MNHLARSLVLALALIGSCFIGCSERSVGPKTELSDQDLQQIKDYQQKAGDEWGNKAK